MRRRIALSFLVLFATALTTGNNCDAGQKVTFTFNENDPMVAFAVIARSSFPARITWTGGNC